MTPDKKNGNTFSVYSMCFTKIFYIGNKNFDLLDFPSFSYFFLVFPRLFLYISSISLAKNKKIQTLVKKYVFLTQKLECTSSRGQEQVQQE